MECLRLKLPALQEQFKADGDYRPYPATWLNQTPWIDPVEAERPAMSKADAALDVAMRRLEERRRT